MNLFLGSIAPDGEGHVVTNILTDSPPVSRCFFGSRMSFFDFEMHFFIELKLKACRDVWGVAMSLFFGGSPVEDRCGTDVVDVCDAFVCPWPCSVIGSSPVH